MFGAYSYSPGIWLLLATTLLVAALGGYSWRQRAVPGAAYFAAACVFWTLSLLALTTKTAIDDPALQLLFHTFQATLQLPIVTTIACFTLEYVQPGRWLTRRNLLLLATPPVLVTFLMFTNHAHRLIWRDLSIDGGVHTTPALGGWLAIGYAGVLALIQAAALLWLFGRSPQHRWPVALMLAALVITRSLFIVMVFYPDLTAPLDSAFILTIFPALTYAIALFGFHIFDPLPAARQAVIEQMSTGVIVCDAGWRVVSLNPAAERMLDICSVNVRGKTWETVAPAAPSRAALSSQSTGDAALPPEFMVGHNDNQRQYAPTISPLRDFRGLTIGHLLLLRDVTERRQAQMQIVAQQRALAVLHERESLARDLHDSIGQVLGYANLQTEAAVQLLDTGQVATAAAQLVRLADVLQEAHADIRAQILDLRAAPGAQQPFFTTVRHYLDSFAHNYAIGTELIIDDDLGAALPPQIALALFRILQEALTNTRKHSGAQRFTVRFTAADDRLRMDLTDDGGGFDPAALSANEDHWGLHFMRERAEELGGALYIKSAPDAGACITVVMPWKERQNACTVG